MLLQRLEALPVGSFHYKLLVITGLGWFSDAMDTGLIAFVLPVLGKEWGLSAGQMGAIGSIGLVGMAIGAVIAGSIADKFGRKAVFSATVILYSIATGLCAVSWSYESLLIFRFFVGFGLGGELPVAATLMSEYAPTNLRGRFIVLLESFWGVGWIAAACIAYLFIPVYGWHYAFIIGALPAIYVFFIRLHMPESVRYLLSKGKVEEAQKIVDDLEMRLGVKYKGDLKVTTDDTPTEKPKLKDLWSGKYLARTIMLWIVWFGIVYSYYGIFTWLPAIVYQQGFAFVKTFEYVLLDGVNTHKQEARGIVKFIKGIRCNVNLIPYNPFEGSPYKTPAPATVKEFRNILEAEDVPVVVRYRRGVDIDAACGQLRTKINNKEKMIADSVS